MKTRIELKTVCAVLLAVFTAAGCKKDNPSPDADPASGIAGTYMGTLDVFQGETHYDAVIVVTRNSADEVTLTAKPDEEYSIITPKTLKVYDNGGISIQTSSNDAQGIAIYTLDNKTLSVVTKQTAAADVTYSFEGVRQ
ncbi:hypothetical protein [Parapedobacter sp. DT-150]|uniref:hypothetical protein n=1 Tax=Parapedobacter sp. DT-150 TaxID=3396162 RepID=UPI003F1D8070